MEYGMNYRDRSDGAVKVAGNELQGNNTSQELAGN